MILDGNETEKNEWNQDMFGGMAIGIAWWMVCGEWREENTLWLSLCLLSVILHKTKIKVGLSICPSKNNSLPKICVYETWWF